jgi:uncharacterized membrane protein
MKTIPKKWIYLISIIIIALLIVVVGYYYLIYNATCEETLPGNGPGRGMGGYWTQNYTLLAISAVVIVAIVIMSYYFMSKKVDKHLDDNMKLISQIVNVNSNNNQPENQDIKDSCKTVLLKFLNYNENKVVKKLIENNGTVLQSEISRMPGMGKVKAHRILKDMKIKGIVSMEKYGKTNRINLSKDVKKLFLG